MTVPRLLTVALLATLLASAPAAGSDLPEGMAEITGGEFEMGMPERTLTRTWKGTDWALELLVTETPAHKVTVGTFYMDKFEVTNAQYLTFLDDAHKKVVTVGGNLNTLSRITIETLGNPADEPWWKAIYHLNWKILNPELKDVLQPNDFPGGLPDRSWATKELKEGLKLIVYDLPIPKHWLDHGTIPATLEDHPVMYMSHLHANLFATWAGKHVPREIEWERGARGPDNSVYPWGGTWRKFAWRKKPIENRLNWALLPTDHPARHKNPGILTTPVGSFPDGRSKFGLYDMLGNVWEWTDTVFDKYPGAKSLKGKDLPEQDWWDEAMAVRGGGYNSTDILLRSTFRSGGDGRDVIFRPRDRVQSFGFRCAKWLVPGADRAYQAWRKLSTGKSLPKEGRKLIDFDRYGGIGVEVDRYEERDNHVFVTGRSRTIALLPRAKLPLGIIKDLVDKAAKSRGGVGVVLAIVTTDLDLKVFAIPKPKEDEPPSTTEVEGAAPAGDYLLSYHDGRLQLLQMGLLGIERIGYLSEKAAQGVDPEFKVADTVRLDRNHSWTATARDQAHVKFAVNRRARGDKKRFVFHAVFTTADKSVLNVDWKIQEPK